MSQGFEPRAGATVAGIAYAETTRRILEARDELTPLEQALAFVGAGDLVRWGRLREMRSLKSLAETVGCTVSSASRAMKKLRELGILGWRSARGVGQKSWLALAPQYLPYSGEDQADTGEVARTDNSNLPTTDNTERRVNEETKEERETGPVPSRLYETTCDPSTANGDDETLTPDETHDQDARFAAGRLAVHLFNGLPDRWTMQKMYRRFLAAPIGSCTQVLNVALLGRPSRTVDCPHAYAVAWIATAERKVTHALAA